MLLDCVTLSAVMTSVAYGKETSIVTVFYTISSMHMDNNLNKYIILR